MPGVADKDDPSAAVRERVVKFCKDHKGEMVGDGECGTLAQAALREAGARPVNEFAESPGPGDFAWGELVFVLEVSGGKRKKEPAAMKSLSRSADLIHLGFDVSKSAISVGVLEPGADMPAAMRISSDEAAVRRLPTSRAGPAGK